MFKYTIELVLNAENYSIQYFPKFKALKQTKQQKDYFSIILIYNNVVIKRYQRFIRK